MEKSGNSHQATEKKSRFIYVVFGVLSTAALILMIMYASQFFWIMLPFVFTSWALAADYL